MSLRALMLALPMAAENRRILIVDDERPILLTLKALLSRHKYQVDTAATAAAGRG